MHGLGNAHGKGDHVLPAHGAHEEAGDAPVAPVAVVEGRDGHEGRLGPVAQHDAGDDALDLHGVDVEEEQLLEMPLAKENIMRALSELLGEEASVVDTVLENGGSGLGAAIAAAMSQK